mmetsp:Transcript_10225/g.20001  ORF Transcript_10225/g.20001 Transcript_10225/m.20001 type:complete len:121 (+) Transcript_10225:470-832(+)
MHALSQENPRGDCVSFRDYPISELMHTPTHNDTQFSLVGAGGAGGDIFENEPSGAVQDEEKAKRLWELSAKAVGLPYDSRFSKHFVHPCDTASSSSELWLMSACDQRHRRSPRNCCGNRS